MKNKTRTILSIVVILTLFVLLSSAISELSWASKEQTVDALRRATGLPSLAVGNLNPSARNPGLEILCTSFFDQPGGYCYYYTSGVPFKDQQYFGNITLGGDD